MPAAMALGQVTPRAPNLQRLPPNSITEEGRVASLSPGLCEQRGVLLACLPAAHPGAVTLSPSELPPPQSS